jgi:ubiquinone/menaquinone biosynthesis C-methylase UbiE
MGREIAKVMDASGSDWLERSERSEQENTDLAIANMKLFPTAVIADIGAGTGFYTFRIAPKVSEGKVYAVELQDELITFLKEKKKQTGSENVEVVRGDTLSVNLPKSILDLAIMVDVYHELSWPREIIQSIRKSLKPDGKIVLMEYRGEDPAVHIKPLHKTTVAQLVKEMKANGFILEHRVDELPIQHLLVFRKK